MDGMSILFVWVFSIAIFLYPKIMSKSEFRRIIKMV